MIFFLSAPSLFSWKSFVSFLPAVKSLSLTSCTLFARVQGICEASGRKFNTKLCWLTSA